MPSKKRFRDDGQRAYFRRYRSPSPISSSPVEPDSFARAFLEATPPDAPIHCR